MSEIQWTDRTWNPVRGCSRVSEGCRNCYAERIAARFSRTREIGGGTYIDGPFRGFAVQTNGGPHWTGKVALLPEKLDEPLRWRKPARVFVNSMSDLFHEKLAPLDVARVLNVMGGVPRHTFQVLTKRPKQMKAIMDSYYAVISGERPFRNLWLGVSVEDQATADERAALLRETPAAVRFISYEPALARVDWTGLLGGVHWVIYGGESGPGARPADIEWARSTRDACKAAGVAFFCKQLGAKCMTDDGGYVVDAGGAWPSGTRAHVGVTMGAPRWVQFRNGKGGDPAEWPEDLRVREFPL